MNAQVLPLHTNNVFYDKPGEENSREKTRYINKYNIINKKTLTEIKNGEKEREKRGEEASRMPWRHYRTSS